MLCYRTFPISGRSNINRFLLLGITTSIPVIVCCGIVISGFYIGSEGELEFSLLGTLFGVFSSLFVSLNSIYTKKMIGIVDNNSWVLCYYVCYYVSTIHSLEQYEFRVFVHSHDFLL